MRSCRECRHRDVVHVWIAVDKSLLGVDLQQMRTRVDAARDVFFSAGQSFPVLTDQAASASLAKWALEH